MPASPVASFRDVYKRQAQLRAEGYTVLATLQYIEHYLYNAPPDQQAEMCIRDRWKAGRGRSASAAPAGAGAAEP